MPTTTYPNYETKFSTSPIEHQANTDAQMDLYKRDEQNHKAPKILPFQLEQSAQQLLGSMYENLVAFKSTVEHADAEQSKKDEIFKLVDNLAVALLISLPKHIDNLHL